MDMQRHETFPTVGTIAQQTLLRSGADITVRDASRLMIEQGCSSVVIDSKNDQFLFSVEDLLSYVHNGGNHDTPILDLLTEPILSIPASKRVLDAFEMIERSGKRYLGVRDPHGHLIGIVSFTDLISSLDPSLMLERKTIGNLITRAEPPMHTEDWILEDVIHHFRKMEDAIIIVRDRKPVGIITTKDVFSIISAGIDTNRPLKDFMHSPAITIHRDATINEALSQLKEHGIKRTIVVDDDGEIIGVVTQSELLGIAYSSWINLLKHHNNELRELVEMLEVKAHGYEVLAYTDMLTELGNRRLLHREMGVEIERIHRYGSPTFSLVIIDIDHFKRVNDKYGHLTGDDTLKCFATILRSMIRPSDCVVRWGGEEFAIMLRNTPLTEAVKFSERMQALVNDHPFPHQLRLTISAGIGEFHQNETEISLFHRVDRALMHAKQNGRNQLVTAQ